MSGLDDPEVRVLLTRDFADEVGESDRWLKRVDLKLAERFLFGGLSPLTIARKSKQGFFAVQALMENRMLTRMRCRNG